MDSLWADCNCERTFGALLEKWAVGFLRALGGVGVGEFHIAGAEDLKAVVEVGSRSERLGAEAGAGVVDFDKEQRLGGVIAYSGFNVRGVAAANDEDRQQSEDAERTHKS